eukprot:GEMP01001327.1.p1 GENE.GEMP01001327.1~~GEMP01001327.1.p1  ORF type:complete len:884 (+),score=266.16 GEMP01001327.1:87-2654(+)
MMRKKGKHRIGPKNSFVMSGNNEGKVALDEDEPDEEQDEVSEDGDSDSEEIIVGDEENDMTFSDSEIAGESQPSLFSESDDEGTDGYRKGGYHVVCSGEVYNNRYKVLHKLGWGHFSTVWLCQDLEYHTLVAMKVQKSAQHYTEAAYDEIELLAMAAKNAQNKEWKDTFITRRLGPAATSENFTGTVELLHYFVHEGPNGTHVCMIFEVMGPNVLAVIKRYNFKGVPLELVHKIAFHTLIGLDYLHRICGIIHTDLKPENVLVGCPLGVPVDKHGVPLIQAAGADGSSRQKKTSLAGTATQSGAGQPVSAHTVAHVASHPASSSAAGASNPVAAPADAADAQTTGVAAIGTSLEQIPTEEELTKLPRQERRKWKRKRARLEKRLKKRNEKENEKKDGDDAGKKDGDDGKGDSGSSAEDESDTCSKGTAPDEGGVANGGNLKEAECNAVSAPAGADEDCERVTVKTRESMRLDDMRAKKSLISPPNMRPQLKPTRSDPTLLSSYGEELLLLKMPYHHHLETLQRDCVLQRDKRHGAHGSASQQRRSSEELQSACDEVLKLDLFNHPNVAYKIADLGNACWVDKHFSDEIQTRQYRSPEVIIGAGYHTSADIWSFACMIFELVTGDYLFDPKPSEEYPRDEDHLALCIELLGDMPKNIIDMGRMSKTYFNSHGHLRHIKSLRYWGLDDVCQQKYHMHYLEAKNLASFLLPMLRLNPTERVTAQEILQHPWLRGLPAPELEELFHPPRPLTTRPADGPVVVTTASEYQRGSRDEYLRDGGREVIHGGGRSSGAIGEDGAKGATEEEEDGRMVGGVSMFGVPHRHARDEAPERQAFINAEQCMVNLEDFIRSRSREGEA